MLHHRHLGEERRQGGKASFVATAGVMQHLIFLPRQHRRLKQQTLPGTHLPLFIEEKTQRLKLLANYGRLFIFWWQSLESICGKESLCFLLTGA